MGETTEIEVLVIGAGISGVATVKCMRDAGFKVLAVERTGDVGGLWHYKEKAYGVMKFTHINVSKHNYCFSDYPFPDNIPDYPHNADMQDYIRNYVKHFELTSHIHFLTEVKSLKKNGDKYEVVAEKVTEDEKGVITPTGKTHNYIAKFVAIATGHHTKPSYPSFPGLDSFQGEAYHSVDYNDAVYNKLEGKKVVIVGIGNSAIDVACNAAAVARVKPVYLSTRSGAWVAPNYVMGWPTDNYACRLFLWIPWKISTHIIESIFSLLQGNPKKWGLNPKMHALQTQPTVSPTCIHHIQRGEIKVTPNIQRIEGKRVIFVDGESTEADQLILCTGYKIDLPYLEDKAREAVVNEDTNDLKLYKNAFSPELGHTLAFIGFVQPASGGVITMSETQARWWAELCKGTVSLPDKYSMEQDLKKDIAYTRSRWFHSNRHTIQRDPILYCDEVAAFIGAKPEFKKHPGLAWRLLLGSCGAYQYRLQGPHPWHRAEEYVKKVPVTGLMLYGFIFTVILLLFLFARLFFIILDHVLEID